MQAKLSPGPLIGDAFDLYQKDLFVLTAVPFLGNLAIGGLGLALTLMTGLASLWLDALLGPVVAAVAVVLARDAQRRRRRPLGETVRFVMAHFGPLVILSLAAAFITLVGMFLLILPGLYAAGVLMAYVPMILFGNAGWGALRASYEACKPHAWPLVGLILILALIALIAVGLGGALIAALQGAVNAPILWTGLIMLVSAAFTGFYACVTIEIYTAVTGDRGDGGHEEVFR